MTTSPIAEAVLPLKAQAVERAERYARKIVKQVRTELSAAGNDLRVVAPYPNSSGMDYFAGLAKYRLFSSLCRWRKSGISPSEPCLADVDTNYVAKFVKQAKEDAAAQYELFVAKLEKKIGVVTTAQLDGNHVWAYSYLFVTPVGRGRECWKTQTIINMSKLGKVFNQYPTRRLKHLPTVKVEDIDWSKFDY